MTVLCQTCRHYPGRGELCNAGKRHATAAPKHCAAHIPARHARHVATLRGIAITLLHDGDANRYVATLNAAHKAAEAVRQ